MGANSKEMQRLASYVERGTVQIGVDGLVMVHEGIVGPSGSSPGIPVLSGRHRAGAQVGVGAPPTRRPGKSGSHPFTSPEEARAILSSAKLGDPLFEAVRGPVPSKLDDGFSPKAPDGFMDQAIDGAQQRIQLVKVTA
jgi:hypothetical protein